jgi:hypothetical protein
VSAVLRHAPPQPRSPDRLPQPGGHALAERCSALERLLREDVEEGSASGRHRQGVPKQRAARRHLVHEDPGHGARLLRGRDQRGDLVAHSVGGKRDAGREGLAEREEVRREPPGAGETAVGAHKRVGLVDREEGAGVPGRPPELFVVSRLGQKKPGVGHRRLGQGERHVARVERRRESGDVVELDDARLRGDARG